MLMVYLKPEQKSIHNVLRIAYTEVHVQKENVSLALHNAVMHISFFTFIKIFLFKFTVYYGLNQL